MSYPPPMPISYTMSRELMEPEVPSIFMQLNISFDVAGGVCVRFQHEQFEVSLQSLIFSTNFLLSSLRLYACFMLNWRCQTSLDSKLVFCKILLIFLVCHPRGFSEKPRGCPWKTFSKGMLSLPFFYSNVFFVYCLPHFYSIKLFYFLCVLAWVSCF